MVVVCLASVCLVYLYEACLLSSVSVWQVPVWTICLRSVWCVCPVCLSGLSASCVCLMSVYCLSDVFFPLYICLVCLFVFCMIC